MTAPDEKTLPCHYCGAQPKVETGMGWHRVACSADDVGDGEPCDAEGPSSRSRARAIATWNRVARRVEPPDVIWAGTGLDRLHVPTGTVWRFAIETRHVPGGPQWAWSKHLGSPPFAVIERHNIKWRALLMGAHRTDHISEHDTEGAAMDAALAAAGWKS